MRQYLANIKTTISTFSQGLKLTIEHFFDARKLREPIGVKEDDYFEKKEGIVTLQYPFEELPVPANGRYQLHNEIDDCIVCDKCAKVCPVNCIDIEPIKAVEEIGKTSDGTSKRIYAAKFDIDMAKCCFCGLCTTVCPTECLTMTKEYDFSVFDLKEHNFVFGEMSPNQIEEKKAELEQFNVEKEKAKLEKAKLASTAGSSPSLSEGEKKKPVFKPKVKHTDAKDSDTKKPVFKPKIKGSVGNDSEEKTPVKPVFKPRIKPKVDDSSESKEQIEKPKKPTFRPKIKAKSQTDDSNEKKESSNDNTELSKNKKPVFRPKIKPKK